MLNTDIITSHPAIKDAYDAYTQAEKEQASLGLIASRRHAEWMQEVARLAPGVALPGEPSSTPTEHEKRHAAVKLGSTRKALQDALLAHSDEVAETFRKREQQALAEVRELTARIDEIADDVSQIIRDAHWLETFAAVSVSSPQVIPSDVRSLIVDVAHGGRFTRDGTFLANL